MFYVTRKLQTFRHGLAVPLHKFDQQIPTFSIRLYNFSPLDMSVNSISVNHYVKPTVPS